MTSAVLSGILFLLGIYLSGFQHPLLPRESKLNFSAMVYGLGVLSGIAGWLVFWRGAAAQPAEWNSLLGLVLPLGLAAAISTWRITANGEIVWSLLIGLAPSAAAALWVNGSDLALGPLVALSLPSLGVIAGLGWYLAAWDHPLTQIGALELTEITGSSAPLWASIFGGGEEQVKRLLQDEHAVRGMAALVRRKHFRRTLVYGPLMVAALIVTSLAALRAPGWGWLGLPGAAVGFLPPFLVWRKRKGARFFREALLGRQESFYQWTGQLVPTLFLLGQLAWIARWALGSR